MTQNSEIHESAELTLLSEISSQHKSNETEMWRTRMALFPALGFMNGAYRLYARYCKHLSEKGKKNLDFRMKLITNGVPSV